LRSEPVTLQLRYLQTLTEIAVEKNSTIIFPLPVDTIRPFYGGQKANTENGSSTAAPAASTVRLSASIKRVSLRHRSVLSGTVQQTGKHRGRHASALRPFCLGTVC
jgi:hypothetical protein